MHTTNSVSMTTCFRPGRDVCRRLPSYSLGLPEARVLPSGLHARKYVQTLCVTNMRCRRVARSLLAVTSHSLIVPSQSTDASVLPSELYATEITSAVCPLRVASSFSVATSHNLIV